DFVAFFFQAEDGIRDRTVTGVQTCALPILAKRVNLLREALGDNAQEPYYIAGVRSRGYRLVAAVSPAVRLTAPVEGSLSAPVGRSEERRVGKECSTRRPEG